MAVFQRGEERKFSAADKVVLALTGNIGLGYIVCSIPPQDILPNDNSKKNLDTFKPFEQNYLARHLLL